MSQEDNEPTSPIDPLTIGELITMSEASKLSGLSAALLRDIAQNGRLRTKKSGSIWLTTLAAIEEYKNSRHRGKRTDLGK
jgi:hypothetical protein